MTIAKTTHEVIAQYEKYVMNTYTRSPLVLTKGKGSRIWDIEGHEYLDLFPGWGVSGLGYNHPWVMRAIRGQAGRLIHISNNYYHPLQARAAKKLVEASFDGKVFFSNSGAEAVETAIKLARRWGSIQPTTSGLPHPPSSAGFPGSVEGRYEIIVMERSFHGRTTGALSATGQPKYQEGCEPLLPGFIRVPWHNLEAVKAAITPRTCAILVEPIQGEGGVRVGSVEFLRGLRELCDTHQLLLIADEVQTGMGRTGRMFAYQYVGIEPDMLLLAKTLGGGFPIGAVVAKRAVADAFTPGTHATTYGGSPLGCACILAVFEVIEKERLLKRAEQFGALILKRLTKLQKRASIIREVRGKGLMIGIELTIDGRPIVEACRAQRLLINCTQETILRLLPAMTITRAQLDHGLGILEQAIVKAANTAPEPLASPQ